MRRRLTNAWHNIVIHPIAGVLWLFGCEKWGDWVHGEPPLEPSRPRVSMTQEEYLNSIGRL